MSVLYLDRRDLDVSVNAGRIRIRVADAPARFLPLHGLDHVVAAADMNLGTAFLAALGEAGIALTVLRPRRSATAIALIGRPHADANLRLAQYSAASNPAAALPLARATVVLKRAGQWRLAREWLCMRPDCRATLTASMADLRAVDCGAGNVESLRGAEGAMARAHYAGLRAVLPGALGFIHRARRPPPDPVNAVLSLAYTLLHGRAVQAAWSAGLDPMLGFLHAPCRGRDSLACDLSEPLRPAVDRLVWRLFAEQTLRAEHFRKDGGACLLGKAGRQIFYPAFELHARLWAHQLRRLATRLRRHLRPIVAKDSP